MQSEKSKKMTINQQIENFPNIGPAYLKRLKNLGINTPKDLFFHFPHRYEDFTNFKKISEVKIGEQVTIEGEIQKISVRRSMKKKMFITEALVKDPSGTIRVIWFNQPYIATSLKEGTLVSLAGKAKSTSGGIILSSPVYEKIKNGGDLKHTRGLVSVYPETEGVSSKWLRFIIYPLLKKYINEVEEVLPKEILTKNQLPEIKKALWNIHFPKTKKDSDKAKERFSFEEIFLVQLLIQIQKNKIETQKAPRLLPKKEYIEEFKKSLKFSLTSDQKKVLREILDDLQKEKPMSRLLEGEVGSGKTVVAALCCFIAAKNNYQSAFMAPTEILTEQHFKEIINLFKSSKIKVALLTSDKSKFFSEKKERNIKTDELVKKTREGEIDILIGTHSLIQGGVKFKKLGLVVIDEQHRFGVEQRAKLVMDSKIKNKTIPHFLSMTATPIPRTLALVFYSDLSISQIKELPRGRKKIETKIIPPKERKNIYDFLKKEVNKGRQAFIICPLIEESAILEITAAKKEFERLKKEIFPDLKLGLLHGKMKSKEKERAMKDFKEGKIQILVATPVVEVGIDVPNATVMIIEGADRFGLSQLYQLRGRVGRGKHKSYCFLFTDSNTKTTWRRLKAIENAKDAFELAEKDLKIRGPGDFIGKRQAGFPDIAMAALANVSLVKKAKEESENILKKDPTLKNYPLLKKKISEFKEKVFLE